MIPGVGDREDAMQAEDNGLLNRNDLKRLSLMVEVFLDPLQTRSLTRVLWGTDVRVVLVVSFLDLGLFL